MWQIRRLFIDHIGPASARFLDVGIDCADPDGRPLDSILWLRNGGGKSTLMSLLGAVLRPRRTDFLSSSQTDKHLEDYVLGGDCAHVVIEWADETGRRLLTGGVYEWMDQVRPADPSRDHDRLNQRWWLLVPGAGAELEDLPFARGGRRLAQDEFLAGIRELHAQTEVIIARSQEEWRRALDDRGIDSDLFGVIIAMNQTEGGIETQFQFSNTDQFVRKILDLVVDPQEPAQIAQIIERVSVELADRPTMSAERDFTGEAIPRLEELANAVTTQREADDRLRRTAFEAVRLRSAIRLAVTAWEARASEADALRGEASQVAREERVTADRLADKRDELRRLAALMRQETAAQRLEDAKATAAARELEASAWRAVPHLQRREALRARVESLRAQADADQAAAEPFRLEREMAGGRYATALDRLISELERLGDKADQNVEAGRARAALAREALDAIRDQRSALESRVQMSHAIVDEVDQRLAAARGDGLLEPDESVANATERVARSQREVDHQEESLVARRRAIAEELAAIEAGDTQRAQRAGDLRQQRGELGTELDSLRNEISSLAADARLILVSGEDEPNPIASGRALIAALDEQAAGADQRLIDLRLAGAEDERAVAGIGDGGLYPPTLDLVSALNALRSASIPADYGWSYLADSVAPERRLAVLAREPAIAGGIVLHDASDLARAEGALGSAGISPTSLIAVGLTDDLEAASGDSTGAGLDRFVVPPRPAMFDRETAQAELVGRDIAQRRRAEEADGVRAQRDTDRHLAQRLDDLLARCSAESLAQFEQQVAALDAALVEIAAEHAADDTRRGVLRVETERIEADLSDVVNGRVELVRSAERLSGLAERDLRRSAALADIETAEQQLRGLPAKTASLGDEERAAAAETERAVRRAQQYRDQMAWRRHEREQIGVATIEVDGEEPLEGLKHRWEEADRAWRSALGTSAALAALSEAESTLADQERMVARLSGDVREEAERLAATPAASDETGLSHGLSEAEREQATAHALIGEAAVELREAQTQVEETRPRADRQRHLRLEEQPSDEAEARRMAEQAEIERAGAQQRTSDAEQAERDRKRDADDARGRAERLGMVAQLLAAAGDEDVETDSFSGEVDEARAAADAAAQHLAAAQASLEEAAEQTRKLSLSLGFWANEERFTPVKAEVRGRFTREDFLGEIGDGLPELIGELRLYHENVTGRLGEIEAHKDLAVEAMASAARRAVDELRRLERLSELPASLRRHAGERFLQISPKSMPADHGVQRDRVSRSLDTLLDSERTEFRGMELLWRAVKALVGEAGFRAKLLKPTTSDHVERVAPEGMRKWSGGERVTMAVLLDCAVFRLRARNRGREVPGIGVLPLDNPLGKASHIAFLDLQRQVAASVGVQLIYLTAVGDMRAVGRFPNVVRMANRPHRGREYVHVAGRDLAETSDEGRLAATAVQRRLDEVVSS